MVPILRRLKRWSPVSLGTVFMVGGAYVGWGFYQAAQGQVIEIDIHDPTVNLHINAAHHSEDERKMEQARIDHDLLGWRSLLIVWGICALLAAWLGGRYVASRPTGGLFNLFGHLIFTIASVLTLVIILWYPQLMLGTSAMHLSTDKAREIDQEVAAAKRGEGAACPDCLTPAPMTRSEEGEICMPCSKEGCKTIVVAGLECEECGTKAAIEHTCASCGSVSAVIDLFPTTDAW